MQSNCHQTLVDSKESHYKRAKGNDRKLEMLNSDGSHQRSVDRTTKTTNTMYWAVLNQTLGKGFFLTTAFTTRAVVPAMTIGHGWGNSRTVASSGMKATDVAIFSKEMRDTGTKKESLTTPNRANATTPFR